MLNICVASVADLDHLLRIQTVAYGAFFNEPAEALLAKLMLADNSSFIAEWDGEVCGYGIAFPWKSGEPVALHSIDLAAPTLIDVMYIHDVAVDPQHHKKGIAQAMIDAMVNRATELGLMRFELVAVQDSFEFWKRNGFVEHGVAGTEYGTGALKMRR